MIKFYFNGSPNPNKVALFLEESGLAYQPIPIDARKGEQSIQMARCRSSRTRKRSSSIATRSCSTLPKRAACFCRLAARRTEVHCYRG